MTSAERDQPILNMGVDRYALRACRKHADQTVAVCGPEPWDFGPHIPEDGVRVVRADDPGHPESVLAALHRAGLKDTHFAGVHSGDDWTLMNAGVISRLLGCSGIDPDVALYFRDKALQKQKIREAGISTAPTVVIEDIRDVSSLQDADFKRSVIKPISFGGTGYTSTVTDFDGLSAVSRSMRDRNIPRRTFLLEEFVDGDEWVADGVVFEGELLFLALGKYGEPCLNALTEQRAVWVRRFDPTQESWAYEAARPLVEASLSALGLSSGVFHMELFHNPVTGQFTFGECAARRGGGLTQEVVLFKFNVDLAECGVLCSLGRRPELNVKIRPEAAGHTHLLGRPGTLISHPSVSEVMELPYVEYARFEHPFGTSFPEAIEFVGQSLGLMVVKADSVDDFASRVADLQRWVDERLIVAPPGMPFREHREWHEQLWPEQAKLGGSVYEPPSA
ncbi:acetyl-CoA carboxylase biotin carboxylase subunit family protein [Streptomyces sp. NPDC005791]|uniref:ATP-grasp domain-containing protein n=1 Tax=Streptomyces sp. NPDC005791 TaxID=3364732 RepID=UPI0036B28157